MSREMAATCTMSPGDPFSDAYVIDFEDDYSPATKDQVLETTISQKAIVTVPILDTLPHLEPWSPRSPSSLSSATTSPTQSSFTPINWTNEDLMYLISCLHPDLALTSALYFSPPLSDLATAASPTHLCLYQKVAPAPPSPGSFLEHLPIGTGRPVSSILIASSHKSSATPSHARKSLALALLSTAPRHAIHMLDKYNVLATLYAQSTHTLVALHRGMIEMLGVADEEWEDRYEQLVGQVDGGCVLEARMEVFLLGVGREEAEGWVGVVEGATGMDGGMREEWRETWGDIAGFLGGVLGEMGW